MYRNQPAVVVMDAEMGRCQIHRQFSPTLAQSLAHLRQRNAPRGRVRAQSLSVVGILDGCAMRGIHCSNGRVLLSVRCRQKKKRGLVMREP